MTFPIWLPGVTGHFAKGSTSVDVDRPDDGAVTEGDRIVTELEFALVGRGDARFGRTIVYADFFGVSIEKTADFQVNAADAEASLGALVGRALVGPRVVQGSHGPERTAFDLDALAGVRGYYVDAEIERPAALAFEEHAAWADPLVAVRGSLDLYRRWAFTGMADIGGFGVGSNLSWSASLEVSYSVSRQVDIMVGYSWMFVDKDTDRGPSDLALELQLRGPELGVTIRF